MPCPGASIWSFLVSLMDHLNSSPLLAAVAVVVVAGSQEVVAAGVVEDGVAEVEVTTARFFHGLYSKPWIGNFGQHSALTDVRIRSPSH